MRDRGKRGPIKEPWRSGRLTAQPSPFSFLKKILIFVGIVVVLTWLFNRIGVGPAFSWKAVLPSKASPIALPKTGNITLYQRGQRAPGIAEFKVIASSSSPEIQHLVKLIDETSNEPVLSVFVRNGETVTIRVPLGSYKINMAQGARWYGETKMFGHDMLAKQERTPLVFSASQNSITGHTLRLERTIDGNYPTRPLSSDQF